MIALQLKFTGWLLFAVGLISLLFNTKNNAKLLLLVYLSLGLLGLTPINTDISPAHMFMMGATLLGALFVPILIAKYIYKSPKLIPYKFHHGRKWLKSEIFYILSTAGISYFLLPFYLKSTEAYLNWQVEPGFGNITRLFIGTNALGIWDELFFVNTVLGLLRRQMPFVWANLVQSVLFTAFLYELGFTGWGFIAIFVFALVQGYIFKRTESLLYVITIHLTLDFILFLALIEAHHPTWLPIFVT